MANINKGLKQAFTLMCGQFTEKLWDKLETNSKFTVISAAKNVIGLNEMIHIQAHETKDTRRKRSKTLGPKPSPGTTQVE